MKYVRPAFYFGNTKGTKVSSSVLGPPCTPLANSWTSTTLPPLLGIQDTLSPKLTAHPLFTPVSSFQPLPLSLCHLLLPTLQALSSSPQRLPNQPNTCQTCAQDSPVAGPFSSPGCLAGFQGPSPQIWGTLALLNWAPQVARAPYPKSNLRLRPPLPRPRGGASPYPAGEGDPVPSAPWGSPRPSPGLGKHRVWGRAGSGAPRQDPADEQPG